MKYRKKPVVIEAVQWTGENVDDMMAFTNSTIEQHGDYTIRIETLEGIMTASVNDWIIKGVEGEFYPCKPGIFAKTYEPA